jgi:competence protein ComEC
VALSYTLLLVPFLKISRRWRSGVLVACTLMLTGAWLVPARLCVQPCPLRVTYLDVGQGNSAVVEFPGNAAMLIDGGGFQGSTFDVGRHVVAPFLWHRGIRRLEAMVLSHAHADHFKGLRFVAVHFGVKQFWFNNVPTDDPEFLALVHCLTRRRIPCLGPEQLWPGRRIQGVDVHILHPSPSYAAVSGIPSDSELNNLSLVVQLTYGDVSFLFPGDIERETEYLLASSSRLQPVEVLLAPHHGSRTSSSMPFLRKLQPRFAVFSLGFDNPLHLPAAEVCQRYRALHVRTRRTDRHGAITFRTDGHAVAVETFLEDGGTGTPCG